MKINFNNEIKITEKIKKIRIKKGFTQQYMAEKLFIDTVNYGRIERGQTKITIDRLIKIAQILDVDINELLKDGEIKEEQTLNKILETENQILKELKKIKKILTTKF